MINLWKDWKTKTSRQVLKENYESWEESISQVATDNPQLQLKNPEADLIHNELWEAVESALTHLNPDYRMAVILSDIEGFSYKEISVLMECSIGTVMSRLARAREHLGRLLAKYKERM